MILVAVFFILSHTKHAGTDLLLNITSPSYLATALKKNSQHVQTKRSLVCKQTAHAHMQGQT